MSTLTQNLISFKPLNPKPRNDLDAQVTEGSTGLWSIFIACIVVTCMYVHIINLLIPIFILPTSYNNTLNESWWWPKLFNQSNTKVDFPIHTVDFTFIFHGGLLSSLFLSFSVTGKFSDKFGRVRITCWSLALLSFCRLLPILSSTLLAEFLSRFLCGLFSSALFINPDILLTEIITNNYRSFALAVIPLGLTLSLFTALILAHEFMDYAKISLLEGAINMFTLLLLFFIEDAPHYMFFRTYYKKKIRMLPYQATIHCRFFPRFYNINIIQISKVDLHLDGSFCVLFTTKETRTPFICILVTFFIVGFTLAEYVAIIIIAKSIELPKVITVGIYLLSAIPITVILLHIFHHKVIILLSYMLSNILLIIGLFRKVENLNVYDTCVQLALFFFLITIYSLFNYTPRVFPILMRAQCYGLCCGLAYLGAGIGYYVVPIIIPFRGINTTTIIILTVIFVPACTTFYHVHKRELPDLLEDLIYFETKYKPIRLKKFVPYQYSGDQIDVELLDIGAYGKSVSDTLLSRDSISMSL